MCFSPGRPAANRKRLRRNLETFAFPVDMAEIEIAALLILRGLINIAQSGSFGPTTSSGI